MYYSKVSRFSMCLCLVGVLAFFLQIVVSRMANAQAGCIAPSSNNQYWAPNTPITVFIDPNLSQQEQAGVNAAVADWKKQNALSGNNIILTPTATDPGPNAPNTIRVVDNPAGSPNNLAFTSTNVSTQNPGQMFNATISVNDGFKIDATTPAYDPNGANAANFLNEVFDHEFGHVFGENDSPVPSDSSGDPNACGQTPGASTMNGYCGTNDTGPPSVSSTVTPCDSSVVNKDIPQWAIAHEEMCRVIYTPAICFSRSLAKYCACPSSMAFRMMSATNSGVSPSA
jgi:hypothetical protein